MHNSLRDRPLFALFSCASSASPTIRRNRWYRGLFVTSLVAAITVSLAPTPGQAQTPAPLTTLLSEIDTAANSHNAATVLNFYGPTFTHSDGLTRSTLQTALTNLWKRYPDLTYRTELKSWKQTGNTLIAETVTYITGSKKEGDRQFKLTAELTSRQHIENQKIVRQEILDERSQITSGANPPTVKINLPATVKSGQEFHFDAVVQEPLGDDLLLGAALEEPIKPDGFLDDTTAKLEPLVSGGIFKVGKAPRNGDQHWLSAVVVRYDGITMVTQRLKVLN